MEAAAHEGRTRLQNLAALALEVGSDQVADEATQLDQRILDGLFYVAFVGQFKRGKSSLLNALVNQPVLPVGVVPVTSVATVLRFGRQPYATARFPGGIRREIEIGSLAEYVSEEKNPGNRKNVAAVEVYLPSPLLESGMCFVDTPGVGSVFTANTEATRAFVPHIDAAVIVVGADPPISADELSLLKELAPQCHNLLVVLNKADMLPPTAVQESRDFTRRILAGHLSRDVGKIFEVSAVEQATAGASSRDWAPFTERLSSLSREAGAALVRAAEARGWAILSARLQARLEEERGALLRPLEESERRIEGFRTCLVEADRALGDLRHLLTAERERARALFADRREEFLKTAQPQATQAWNERLFALPFRRGPALREEALKLSWKVTEEYVRAWADQERPKAEGLYVEISRRFADLANGALERLAAFGGSIAASLPPPLKPEAGFRVKSQYYFTEMMHSTRVSPLGWLLDWMRPRRFQLRALQQEIGQYLEELLFVNANRVANDFDERVLESHRRFESEVRTSLEQLVSSAELALRRANERRSAGESAVREELGRLAQLGARLEALAEKEKESLV